jgi:hypothetical protein
MTNARNATPSLHCFVNVIAVQLGVGAGDPLISFSFGNFFSVFSKPSVAQRNRTAFELGPPSRKRERPELGREGHHGAHRAHGEKG